jgi:hypothetical protein
MPFSIIPAGDAIHPFQTLEQPVENVADRLARLGASNRQDDRRGLPGVPDEHDNRCHNQQRQRRRRQAHAEIIAKLILLPRIGRLDGAQMQVGEHEHRRSNCQTKRKHANHCR